MKKWLYLLLLNLVVLSCARLGSPVGGKKDSLAPKFLHANIDSSRVKVPTDLKELRLYFDEYITLKETSKNLIISPSIKKIKKILPSSLGNKFILIQWEDELLPNTTYNFNFGNAVADLNEGNVLPYFTYAFSTGEKLDDIYISGTVEDAMKPVKKETTATAENAKNAYVVGLYKDSDSIDFHQKPFYITKADPDGYFELNYLTPGNYQILAFKDENENSVFDAGKEDVGFSKEKIELSKNISGLKIKVFPSRKRLKFSEAKEVPGGILLLFDGKPENVEITPQFEKLTEYKVTHRPKSDSVNVWFDAVKLNIGQNQSENLKFGYVADTLKGNGSIFYRMNVRNEFTLVGTGNNILAPHQKFAITANYPVTNIAPEKWQLKKDSTNVNFSAKINEKNNFEINVDAAYEIGGKYQLMVPSGTVSSYYAQNKKAYQFNFEIDKPENYGSLTLNIQNKPEFKYWIQLVDEQSKVLYSQYTDSAQVKFPELKPGKYNVRMLVDNNGNGEWDVTDFTAKTYAEDVYLFDKTMEIRPLWENVETWDLKALPPENTSEPQKPLEPNSRK